MRLRRRTALAGAAAGMLLPAGVPAGAQKPGADFLEDGRTARGVLLSAPRASLGECVAAVSRAVDVPLSVSPALQDLPLVGYVPRRPLRELMSALGELFDARWVTAPAAAGTVGGFRLEPAPKPGDSPQVAREKQLTLYLRRIDELASEVMKEYRAAGKTPEGRTENLTFGLLLWSCLSPQERSRTIHGQTVTAPVPAPLRLAVGQMLKKIAKREEPPNFSSLLVTFDLEDSVSSTRGNFSTDDSRPSLRGRATGLQGGDVVGALGYVDFLALEPPPRPKPPPPGAQPKQYDGDPLPGQVGTDGRIDGARDEQLLRLGAAGDLPILSRHRSRGGSGEQLLAGGRKSGEVLDRLAASCDAELQVTSRGFYLMRSLWERIDPLAYPSADVVQRYLARRLPSGQAVPFLELRELASLNSLQLSVLSRINRCDEEGDFVRHSLGLYRFYESLSPAQREALFGEAGLAAEELTHVQIHALVEERDKRGQYDVFSHLQKRPGLRLRFQPTVKDKTSLLLLQCLRDGKIVVNNDLELPVVEAAILPRAMR